MSFLAQVSYTGDGSTTQYSIPFPFIDSTHVKAFIDAVETTAFTISSSTLTFNSAPANSSVIKNHKTGTVFIGIYYNKKSKVVKKEFKKKTRSQVISLTVNEMFKQALLVI